MILASPVDVSLVCAVSADLEMHRGIAREFKKTFENINELKQQSKYKMSGDSNIEHYMYTYAKNFVIPTMGNILN